MSHRHDVPLVIIPDHDDPGCADVFVDGTLNGHPCRFILDTGAAQTHLVSDEVTRTFGSHGARQSRGVLGGSHEHVVQLSDVTVGPMTRKNFEALRFDENHPAPRNLLGMDVLGEYCCHFHFSSETLTIQDREPTSNSLPLLLDTAGHPTVPVQLGHAETNAVWDTGAGITVVDTEFISQNLESFTPATPSWGTDTTGTKVETPTFTMSHAKIAGKLFEPHRVAAIDLSQANGDASSPLTMILGYTTLRQANWYFNFAEHWWEITSIA